MWGLREQVIELRRALVEILLIAQGDGPEDNAEAFEVVERIAKEALEKQ
jgi:hypothetical protein